MSSKNLGLLVSSLALLALACNDPDIGGPAQVAEVRVTPSSRNIPVGGTVQLSAFVLDAQGGTLTGRSVIWSSSAETVATVSATGLVTGVSPGGPVTMTASSEGRPGTAQVTVTGPAPVAAVSVFPGAPSILVGTAMQLVATAKDAQGNTLRNRAITWSSSAEAVATVDATGIVTGVSAGGPVTITATSEGQLGTAQLTVTAPLPALSFASMSAGYAHTCGLTPAGEAWCWGSNVGIRLGTATPDDRTNLPVPVDGGMTFSKIFAGGGHSCALSVAGAAFCWGYDYGSAPTALTGGFTFTTLSTGYSHICGLSPGGIARCWGDNENSALGDGSSTNRDTPTLVAGGISFTAISVGAQHTCALSSASAAWCWGLNEDGQLGDGTLTRQSSPVSVMGGHVFESIVAGGFHTCARKANGEVWCWGYGGSGAVGDGAFMNRNTPVMVAGGNAFVSVTAGGENTCGLLESGLLKCWGLNDVGEVGDGTTTDRSTPVSVSGGHVFLTIAAPGLAYHTCGLKAGGVPWCWGWNGGGQLGDGSFLDRVVPTPVHAPVLMGAGAAAPTSSRVRESSARHRVEQRSEWRGRRGISRRHSKE